jgi:hypothetical protein
MDMLKLMLIDGKYSKWDYVWFVNCSCQIWVPELVSEEWKDKLGEAHVYAYDCGVCRYEQADD